MAQQPVVTKNRNVPLDKIRNIGVIAHIDSGKTTTSERFLFYTGKTYKIGDIDDGASMIFDGRTGVEPQSETVWRQADKYKVPRICFINKMDKLGADFEATVAEIKDRLGANPIIMTVPIGKESEFKGVIDLLTLKAKIWDQDPQGIKYTVTDAIPEDIKDKVTKARSKMIEQIAEHDDTLLNKYLNGEEIN